VGSAKAPRSKIAEEASPSLAYGAGLLIPLGRYCPSRVQIALPPLRP
jgi:hypothetical protein